MATLTHTNVQIAPKDVYPHNIKNGSHKYNVTATNAKVYFPLRSDGTCVTTGETGLTKVAECPKIDGQIPLCESSLTLPVVGKVSIEGITADPDWNTRVFRRDMVSGMKDILSYDPALTGADLLKTQKFCKIV
jgi:hypothetical protein